MKCPMSSYDDGSVSDWLECSERCAWAMTNDGVVVCAVAALAANGGDKEFTCKGFLSKGFRDGDGK